MTMNGARVGGTREGRRVTSLRRAAVGVESFTQCKLSNPEGSPPEADPGDVISAQDRAWKTICSNEEIEAPQLLSARKLLSAAVASTGQPTVCGGRKSQAEMPGPLGTGTKCVPPSSWCVACGRGTWARRLQAGRQQQGGPPLPLAPGEGDAVGWGGEGLQEETVGPEFNPWSRVTNSLTGEGVCFLP